MRINQIILPKSYFILTIFQKLRSYPTVLFIPREYYSLKIVKLNAKKWNYPAKKTSSIKHFSIRSVPHRVVAVVNDTVWAREPASLFTSRVNKPEYPHGSAQWN